MHFRPWILAVMGMALGASALADVQTVTLVTIDDQTTAAPPGHYVVTTQWQADRARMQFDNGDVVLYDLKDKMVYQLHAEQKTFSVVPIGQVVPPVRDDRSPRLPPKAPKVDIDIKVRGRKDQRTVAGFVGSHVTLTATATSTFNRPRPEGGAQPTGDGGGNRGGGGHHRGGGGGPGGGGQNPLERQTQVQGDLYLSDSVFPNPGPLAAVPWCAAALGYEDSIQALLEPLTEQLGKQHKGFPIASHLVVDMTNRQGTIRELDVTTELQSVSNDPLDPGLFQVPPDYRQDVPPARTVPSDLLAVRFLLPGPRASEHRRSQGQRSLSSQLLPDCSLWFRMCDSLESDEVALCYIESDAGGILVESGVQYTYRRLQ